LKTDEGGQDERGRKGVGVGRGYWTCSPVHNSSLLMFTCSIFSEWNSYNQRIWCIDTPQYAGIEIKTKVTKGTITVKIQLQEKVGFFAIVIVFEDPGLGQVLSLMACG
jgi:hypothetical protein